MTASDRSSGGKKGDFVKKKLVVLIALLLVSFSVATAHDPQPLHLCPEPGPECFSSSGGGGHGGSDPEYCYYYYNGCCELVVVCP
jgi:hypothetical protein